MRNFAELNARIGRGETISIDEMTARYFPLRETWQEVAQWAAGQGLTIENEDPIHLTVATFSSVAQVQTALSMKFARVRGTDRGEYTSAVSAPAIPEDFRAQIVSVLKLQPHLRPLPSPAVNIRQIEEQFILPQTFAEIYNATDLGVDGTGQTIVILGGNRVNPDDLTAFWQRAGLPTTAAKFTGIDIDSRVTTGENIHASEETMDVEWASAMAPGADLICVNSVSMDAVSLYFPRPTWQQGPGIPPGTKRCVPDVAALASCNFAPYMYFLGKKFPAAGTSLSAPIWAGLCSLINQARAAKTLPPLGLLGPRIYPLIGSAAFNQMTTGSQSGGDGFSTTATNGAYMVGPNYNLVSGLGSPNVEFLIAALTGPEATPTPPPEPTPTSIPTPVPTPTNPSTSAPQAGGGGEFNQWFVVLVGLLLLVRKASQPSVRKA